MQWMVVLAACIVGCATDGQETRTAPAAPTQKEYAQAQGDGVTQEQQEAIDTMFRRKAQELQSCWQDEYERTKNCKLEGNVTVGLTVMPRGKAQNVRILESSMKSPDLEKCVVQTVSTWGFPEVNAPCPYMRTVHL